MDFIQNKKSWGYPFWYAILEINEKDFELITSKMTKNEKRQEHAIDTRAKKVGLTDEGKKLIKQAMKSVESMDHVFFESLGDNLSLFNQFLLLLLGQKPLP